MSTLDLAIPKAVILTKLAAPTLCCPCPKWDQLSHPSAPLDVATSKQRCTFAFNPNATHLAPTKRARLTLSPLQTTTQHPPTHPINPPAVPSTPPMQSSSRDLDTPPTLPATYIQTAHPQPDAPMPPATHASSKPHTSRASAHSGAATATATTTPEYECHHMDCRRRFIRKTSLTNHLKAHQNIRSRSIYRTKRARLRAAAAMQAAAIAVSTRAAGATEPAPQTASLSHSAPPAVPAVQHEQAEYAFAGNTAAVTGTVSEGAVAAVRVLDSDTSPGSTFASSSKTAQPTVAAVPMLPDFGKNAGEVELVGDSRRHVHEQTSHAVILQELKSSLASPTSYSTLPAAENADSILLAKALDAVPSWQGAAREEDNSVALDHSLAAVEATASSANEPRHADFLGDTASMPAFPTFANYDFLPQDAGFFSDDIEALQNCEFLGDFVYNNNK